MESYRNTMIAGAFVYGALALVGLFVLGVVTGNHAAALAAIVSAGAAYGAQVAGALAVDHERLTLASLALTGTAVFAGFVTLVLLLIA